MIQVRTKDKIFLAVVLPCALLAGYYHFVRAPRMRHVKALALETRNLPDPDNFPAERIRLETRVKEAQAELEAARAEKPPEGSVMGDPAATAAARQDAVVALLTAAGGRVVRVAPPAETPDENARGGNVLLATGLCPAPEARRFTVEADYAAALAFLKACADRQLPVVPEGVSLTTGTRTCRWEMTLWL